MADRTALAKPCGRFGTLCDGHGGLLRGKSCGADPGRLDPDVWIDVAWICPSYAKGRYDRDEVAITEGATRIDDADAFELKSMEELAGEPV